MFTEPRIYSSVLLIRRSFLLRPLLCFYFRHTRIWEMITVEPTSDIHLSVKIMSYWLFTLGREHTHTQCVSLLNWFIMFSFKFIFWTFYRNVLPVKIFLNIFYNNVSIFEKKEINSKICKVWNHFIKWSSVRWEWERSPVQRTVVGRSELQSQSHSPGTFPFTPGTSKNVSFNSSDWIKWLVYSINMK